MKQIFKKPGLKIKDRGTLLIVFRSKHFLYITFTNSKDSFQML